MRSSITLVMVAMTCLACGDRREIGGGEAANAVVADGEATGHAGDTLGGCRADCVRLEEVVLLGDADGPGIIEGESGTARRDSGGRYYVFREFGSNIKVFSPRGEYVTTIGREGSGPGEFRGLGTVQLAAGDSLHVVDLFNLRWSVYSPEHELVRSVRPEIPVYMQLSVLPDGRGLFSAPMRRAGLERFPLHLLAADGSHLRSFGAAPDEFGPPGYDGEWRKLSRAGATSVWAAYRDRYRIELWDADAAEDRPLRVIERTVDWYPPGLEEEMSLDAPPTTRTIAIRQDQAGRLIALMWVADANWREAIEPGEVHPTVSDRNGYYDTRIEILDATSGELLASVVAPQAFHAFVADDLVIASVTDAAGIPHVAVWRISSRLPS